MTHEKKFLQASVEVSYSRNFPIPDFQFEMDDRADPDELTAGTVRIRKYPADSEKSWNAYLALFGITSTRGETWDQKLIYKATEGTVYPTGEIRFREIADRVTVSGTDRITLRYPMVDSLRYSLDGMAYDERGDTTSVSLAYDSDKNELIASRPFYGVVDYSFRTSYRILRYVPNAYADFRSFYLPDPKDYGTMLVFVGEQPNPATWGNTSRASLPPPIPPVIFSIQPPRPIQSEFELFRVISTAIINENGEWEKPTGWPTTGTFPVNVGEPPQEIDPSGSFVEVERVHEITHFSLKKVDQTPTGVQSERLPLNYDKEYRNRGLSISTVEYGAGVSYSETVKQKSEEYYKRYDKLRDEDFRMTTRKYNIAIAKPYDTAEAITATVEYRVLKVSDGTTTTTQVIPQTYKIRLTPTPGIKPRVSPSQSVSEAPGDTLEERQANVETSKQAAILNGYLSQIWEGVDWVRLRKVIEARYRTDIYQFDWSKWPTN